MTGFLDLQMILKLKNLRSLDLSYNNLALSLGSPVKDTFQTLESLRLSLCNLTEFPFFLKDSKVVKDRSFKQQNSWSCSGMIFGARNWFCDIF